MFQCCWCLNLLLVFKPGTRPIKARDTSASCRFSRLVPRLFGSGPSKWYIYHMPELCIPKSVHSHRCLRFVHTALCCNNDFSADRVTWCNSSNQLPLHFLWLRGKWDMTDIYQIYTWYIPFQYGICPVYAKHITEIIMSYDDLWRIHVVTMSQTSYTCSVPVTLWFILVYTCHQTGIY